MGVNAGIAKRRGAIQRSTAAGHSVDRTQRPIVTQPLRKLLHLTASAVVQIPAKNLTGDVN